MHIALMAVSAATTPSGVCRHAANLARGLQSIKGVDQVTLIIGAWQANYFANSLDVSGSCLRIVTVEIPNTSLRRNAWYLFQLPALTRSLHAEILHLAFPVPFPRSAMPIPVVLTMHDLYPLDLPRNFGGRAWLNRLALHVALRNADVAVCVSAHTRRRLREIYPRLGYSSVTIPHPISCFDSSSIDLFPRDLEGYPFLLCVAQHRANKNLLTLVHGFNAALQKNTIATDTRLVIVGNEGPETRALLAEIDSLQLTDRVLLLRGLPDATLAALYRRCELFIAASILEGFGLPVAEAIVHGSRVLCSDIPAFRELGADACVLFPANSTAAQLAGWIAAALAAPRSIGHNQFLTLRQSANRYLAVYQSLLSPKLLPSSAAALSEQPSTGDA